MENRKAKRGWTGLLILGVVFTVMGMGYVAAVILIRFADIGANEDVVIAGYAFGGLGAVFLFVGIICLFVEISKRMRCNRLIRAGQYVMTEVSEISINYNVCVNLRHPHVVVCRYQDPYGNVHLFRSRNLMFDPAPYLHGQMIKVYMDGENYKNYYMDIDAALPNIIQH